MSVQASTWVIQNSKQKGSALLVLMMIANYAHADGTNAFPSIETLAHDCRMSTRQVTRIVKALEASEELAVDRSAGRHAHRYALPSVREWLARNGDKMSGLNPDKMSALPKQNRPASPTSTLTSCPPNPDKSGTPPTPPYKDNQLKKSHPLSNESGDAEASCTAEEAVGLCRRITKRGPNEEQRAEIRARVTDLTTWESVLRGFMLEGQPPNHVDWMLERYEAALPPPEVNLDDPHLAEQREKIERMKLEFKNRADSNGRGETRQGAAG